VRQLLEPGNLLALQFGDSPLSAQSAGTVSGPFWELKSSIVLPKIANTQQLVHPGKTEAEPFLGDYSRIVLVCQPPFSKGELHYRRSEISAVGLFDIAMTFERYMEPRPALVVSQNFYKYCLANGIGVIADPVRVDPD
jgi:hypothetical protein